MHEVVNVVVQKRQVMESGNLPEIERTDKKSRRRYGMGEGAEGAANDAVRDDRSHNAPLCPTGCAGDQKTLRHGEEQQHRPDHAEQQMLDLMYQEDSFRNGVYGRLECQEDGGEPGEEGGVPPDAHRIGFVLPAPKAGDIETGNEQRTECDLRCQIPGRPGVLARFEHAMRVSAMGRQ